MYFMYLKNTLAQYFPNCVLWNTNQPHDQWYSKQNGVYCKVSLRNDELNNAKQIPIYSNSRDI